MLFLATAGTAYAADSMTWEKQVSDQALASLGCKVSYISHVVERPFKEGTLVMAKVHCEDKRSFDVLRENDSAPFIFKECSPREKTSC